MINVFKVKAGKEEDLDKLKECSCTIKYDGVRLYAIKQNDEVKLFTRSNKQVYLTKLIEEVDSILDNGQFMDGEIIVEEGMPKDRTSASSLVNRARNTANDGKGYTFMVIGIFNTIDGSRVLKEIYSHICKSIVPEVMLPRVAYNKALSLGYEGIVVYLKDWKYVYGKRLSKVVKFKPIGYLYGTIVSIKLGKGKYEGLIGALIVEVEVEGKLVKINVGSGLDDLDRAKPRSYWIDKKVKIKYSDIIEDMTGDKFVSHPVYVK